MVAAKVEPVEFFEWFRGQDESWKKKPWLVIGKGPSFSFLKGVDTGGFNTFGLNHVVKEVQLDIAHALDLDVIEDCSEHILRNAKYVLMPWFPHVKFRAGRHSLAQLVESNQILAQLSEQRRLLWYNREGWSSHKNAPAIRINSFSGEVPYALLGMAGVPKIRSVGIDGGGSYAPNFDESDLLANKQASYRKQFDGIARSIMAYGIDAAPLDDEGPVRVYVAATAEQLLPAKVLEYSIKKHSSMTTRVVFMHDTGVEIPRPIDKSNWPRTPFSFQRFLIPELAGYKGKAIYLDSDMQVFQDIRELWQQDLSDNDLLSVKSDPDAKRQAQYSVMLMNCDRLDWDIRWIVQSLDDGRFRYEDLMQRMALVERQAAAISPEWNSLESYAPGKTKLLHYTDMDTQPWVFANNPLGHLWVQCLIDAVNDEFIEMAEVEEHVRNGWVRPSLEYQVRGGIADAVLLSRRVLDLDENFAAPYRNLRYRRHASLMQFAGACGRWLKGKAPDLGPLRRLKRRLRF